MGIRISEMEEATTFGADDYVPIVSNGTNKKALGQKIKDYIAGFFVNKSGDTMTGDLTVENASDASYFISKSDNVTLNTSANNNVTAQQVRGVRCYDSNNARFGVLQAIANTDGSVQLRTSARNMMTDGSFAENYIDLTMKKDGTREYAIADSAAFRSAIGVDYEDKSSLISVYSNRITISKKVLNKYSNGKIELFVIGTLSTDLTASQRTLLSINDSTLIPDPFYVSGTASTQVSNSTVAYLVQCSNTQRYINVMHDGLTSGRTVSISATWYV